MNAFPILRRSLGDGWRGLLGWSAGIVGVLALYLPIFPSMAGNGELQQIIERLPPELVNTLGYDDIGTGAGYLQGTFFGLLGYVLLVIAATAWGSSAIAGAEESGRLELALAHGVTRVQYALESAAAVLIRLLVLGVVALAVIAALDEPTELDLELADMVAGTLALVLLAYLSGAVALASGALTGRRAVATAAGAGVAVYGYVLNALANQTEDLEALRDASPYGWAYRDDPLANGADVPGLLLLGGFGLLFTLLAVLVLHRRDIT